MGLEFYTNHFNVICDECNKTVELKEGQWKAATKRLYSMGWMRSDYIHTAAHYLWLCPKCRKHQHDNV